MKQIIAIIISLVMISSVLVACTDTNSNRDSHNQNETSNSVDQLGFIDMGKYTTWVFIENYDLSSSETASVTAAKNLGQTIKFNPSDKTVEIGKENTYSCSYFSNDCVIYGAPVLEVVTSPEADTNEYTITITGRSIHHNIPVLDVDIHRSADSTTKSIYLIPEKFLVFEEIVEQLPMGTAYVYSTCKFKDEYLNW